MGGCWQWQRLRRRLGLGLGLGLGVTDLLQIAARQQVNDRRRAAQSAQSAQSSKGEAEAIEQASKRASGPAMCHCSSGRATRRCSIGLNGRIDTAIDTHKDSEIVRGRGRDRDIDVAIDTLRRRQTQAQADDEADGDADANADAGAL